MMLEGTKFDDGKMAQMSLLDPFALLDLASCAGFGGKKYGAYNYLGGLEYSRLYDSAMRHLLAFWGGEDSDQESGLPHLAHAAWNCLAILASAHHGVGLDNRFVA